MEQPFAALVCSSPDLQTLERVLFRMGLRTRTVSRPEGFDPQPAGEAPDLLLLDSEVAAACPETLAALPTVTVPVAGDPCALHLQLQQALKGFLRRQHLRSVVDIPGILSHGGECFIVRVLSLGTGGAFLATRLQLEPGSVLEVGIPLFGRQQELELGAQVRYCRFPGPENDFRQGVGVAFDAPPEEARGALKEFVLGTLLPEGGGDGAFAISPPGTPPAPARGGRRGGLALRI